MWVYKVTGSDHINDQSHGGDRFASNKECVVLCGVLFIYLSLLNRMIITVNS